MESLGGRIPLISLVHTLAAAEYLNFRHAASSLGVPQSTISTRIKSLEETLGILLFERRHRGVKLTEAGRRFVAEISVGIGQLDYAVRTAGAFTSGSEGRIAIGLQASMATGFLTDLRRRYRSAYPNVEQSIMEGRSSEIIALVRGGNLDVAVVGGAIQAPDCHSRVLWHETLVIALPQDHGLATFSSINWADLASEIFLVREGGSGPQVFEHIIRRLAEQAHSPRIRRYDVGRDTLMHLVAAGEGITLTSEANTHLPLPGIVFRPIADETERARFSAVWSPYNSSPALMNLLDLATEMSRAARCF